MPYTVETKDNKATFTLTIPQDDVEEGMREAAKGLAKETKIDGFRPGTATYEVLKQRLGEMKILEAAAEGLIRTAFVQAMIAEDLETVGQPFFNAVKMAPGNDLVVTAEVSLYPAITKLADFEKLSVEAKSTEPGKEDIQRAEKDLTLMRTKETRATKDHAIEKGDKVIVNMNMKRDGVVVEGGEAQNHGIFTAEDYFIEGFIDQIIGLKEDAKKTFTLKFPKEHYLKHLSGKDVEFEVEVKEVFLLEPPKLDDAFAKTLGLKDLADLNVKLKENLKLENEREEKLRLDKEVLDLVAKKSEFESIPELLVNQEIEKMIHEIKHSVTQQGGNFEDYLTSIKKSLADLKLDFTPSAITRIKVAIILKEVGKDQAIEVDEKTLDAELDMIAKRYEEDKEAQKRVYEPVYRQYVEQQMMNRKTIDFLKGKIVK